MDSLLIRYHEIALKKGNRRYFIELLKRNLISAVKDLGIKEIRSLPARILLTFKADYDPEVLIERIRSVFGVANFSRVERTARDIDTLRARILESLNGSRFESFRMVEILPHDAFFGFNKIAGPGGLPVGASGRVVALISGGIDSPVAAYRMMQRGCRLIFVHFHSTPYLDQTSQQKVRQLVTELTRCQFRSRLYLIPFGEIQRQIVAAVARPLRVILYRRMMLRIAEQVARREKCKALITGESLAQVASQTLDNIAVIQEAAELPILRPLVGMDKQEIIDQARRIGTYQISSIPDQDCCQLFVPKHPATGARLADVQQDEKKLDIEELLRLGTTQAAVEEFSFPR
jgi:thiamine biosynthesis protein ThiI